MTTTGEHLLHDSAGQHASRRRGVMRGAAAYAAAASFPRLLAILLVPIYTRALDPVGYGQVAMIATLAGAVQGVVSLGLETAVFREFTRLANDEAGRTRLANTVALLALGSTVASVAVGLVLALALAGPLMLPPGSLVAACLGAGLQSAALMLPLARMRADEQFVRYVATTSIGAVGGSAFTIVAVVTLQSGVPGWFVANVLGSLLLLVVGLTGTRRGSAVHFDRTTAAGLLLFGLPLVPHFVAHWALGISDRLVVGAYVGQEAVGVYSLAQQFALPVNLLAVAISQALMPRYAAVHRASVTTLRPILSQQAALVMAVGFGAAVLAPSVILLVAPPSFSEAARLAGWLIAGYVLFGLYLGPMNILSLTVGTTRWIWTATATAAVANVALNLLLVPHFGVLAAAIDTVLGYGVLVALVHLYVRLISRSSVPYDLRSVLVIASLLTATYAVTEWLIPTGRDWMVIAVRVVIASGAAAMIFVSVIRSSRAAPIGQVVN